MENTKVGVIGCGNISGIYFKNMKRFSWLEVAACADLLPEKAQAAATEFGVPRTCTPKELLADPDIAIVLNLTVPKAHYPVALAALKAGKSVYSEKPLAVRREDGRELLALARAKRRRVGGAPDTFLGAGLQTCRRLIDDGAIGQPVAATAFMLSGGVERWHPNPEFYYQPGGGPLFDMGPYYLTALVSLLGAVRRVAGMAGIGIPVRTITSEPKKGRKIKVRVPTHVIGSLEFAGGALGTIITSFEVCGGSGVPRIEVYGTEGTLSVPDPNHFHGPVKLRRPGEKEWTEQPLPPAYVENSRGVGVADMAKALRSGRAHRAAGELTFHVLDIMQSIHEAAAKGRHVKLASTCVRPAPLPPGLKDFELDE